jgi:O-antigen/teichoic acid export membrane protein
MALRALTLLVLALLLLRRRGAHLLPALPQEQAGVWHRAMVMAGNRALSSMQSQVAPLVISALLSPSAVGLYDVMTRVPRFLKVVTGLMNAAVLPLSARLDAASNDAGMRRLGELGLLGVTIATAPICAWGVVFSEPLLHLWIDAHIASYWGWQAVMFCIPLANALTSFGGGALLSRTNVVKQLNLIALAQITLQFALALFCMPWFEERAFIIGQCTAVLVTFPFQMRIIAREKQLRADAILRIAALVGTLCVAIAVCLAVNLGAVVRSPLTLAISLAVWCGLVYTAIWFRVLRAQERSAAWGLLPLNLGRRK